MNCKIEMWAAVKLFYKFQSWMINKIKNANVCVCGPRALRCLFPWFCLSQKLLDGFYFLSKKRQEQSISLTLSLISSLPMDPAAPLPRLNFEYRPIVPPSTFLNFPSLNRTLQKPKILHYNNKIALDLFILPQPPAAFRPLLPKALFYRITRLILVLQYIKNGEVITQFNALLKNHDSLSRFWEWQLSSKSEKSLSLDQNPNPPRGYDRLGQPTKVSYSKSKFSSEQGFQKYPARISSTVVEKYLRNWTKCFGGWGHLLLCPKPPVLRLRWLKSSREQQWLLWVSTQVLDFSRSSFLSTNLKSVFLNYSQIQMERATSSMARRQLLYPRTWLKNFQRSSRRGSAAEKSRRCMGARGMHSSLRSCMRVGGD